MKCKTPRRLPVVPDRGGSRLGWVFMNGISRILQEKEKLACITLDFELDYGDRTGAFDILEDDAHLAELSTLFSDLDTPVSAFIRTDILIHYPRALAVVKALARDFHGHSHTHNTKTFDSRFELATSASTFETVFGHKPLGYRAPQGVLREGDIDLLKTLGYKFSSSVFPAYRPGKFNNRSLPISPFLYDNGIMELPFAVVPTLRSVISLSYLKLLGMGMNKAFFSIFGLPDIVVFDSHLHDFILSETSFNKLPLSLKTAWGIRKHSGVRYFEMFVELLRKRGYRFITMTELYHHLARKIV